MHTLPASHPPRILEDTIQQALREDPGSARTLIEAYLTERPDSAALLRLRAEALARSGDLKGAWTAYRAAAASVGVLLHPLPSSTCAVCGSTDAKLCWVGSASPTNVQAWVRCTHCRTARRPVPPLPQAAAAARRASLEAQRPSLRDVQARLKEDDALIQLFREEDYGMMWLNRPGGSGRANMLVVGSGWGSLLASAEWRGFDAQGVEQDSDAAAWARDALGVVVWESLAQVPNTPQDIIVLASGLGECTDPIASMAALSRRLVPSGLLALSVPCHDHPLHRIQGYDDPRWLAPEATVWFDQDGLSLAMLRAGLQPVRSWHHPTRIGEIMVLARKAPQ